MKKIRRQCMQCGEFKRTEITAENYVCGNCIKHIGRILRSKNKKINRFINENKSLIESNFTLLNIIKEFKKCPICKLKEWLFNRRYDQYYNC